MRVKAACDARDEGQDILILARTDARRLLGMEEAIQRIKLFEEAGADIGAFLHVCVRACMYVCVCMCAFMYESLEEMQEP